MALQIDQKLTESLKQQNQNIELARAELKQDLEGLATDESLKEAMKFSTQKGFMSGFGDVGHVQTQFGGNYLPICLIYRGPDQPLEVAFQLGGYADQLPLDEWLTRAISSVSTNERNGIEAIQEVKKLIEHGLNDLISRVSEGKTG